MPCYREKREQSSFQEYQLAGNERYWIGSVFCGKNAEISDFSG